MNTSIKTFFNVRLLILLSIIVSYTSCIKDRVGDTFYVEGKVLEYGTNKPVANARVVLLESAGEFLGPSYKILVDSIRTDENGDYHFKYIKKPGSLEFYSNLSGTMTM